jgi:alpha-D-xyloside xylohydrolase
MWIDGKLVIEDWKARNVATKTATLSLPADSRVPVKIEYFQDRNPAIIDLRWKPPGDAKPKTFTRKVYLPGGTWFDFWTGQSLAGAKTIDADAPIERLPLFVKAGTILPMGPVVQYASEKPDAPLEVRVYRGADGNFTLYDDAGDGYGYEKGEYATIPLTWNDQAQSLTIGARVGQFPGMAANRQFRVVFVKGGQGAGPDAEPSPDRIVDYNGSAVVVKLTP